MNAEDLSKAMSLPEYLPYVRDAIAVADGILLQEAGKPGRWRHYSLDGRATFEFQMPRGVGVLAARDRTLIGWETDSLQVAILRVYTLRALPGTTTTH